MHDHNNTTIHTPSLDCEEGPSCVQSTHSTDAATFQSVNVKGDRVKLTVSPHRGPAVSFVINLVQPSAQTSSSAVQNREEEDQLGA